LSSGESFDVEALARRLGARLVGNGSSRITGLASLGDAGPSDVSLYADQRYRAELALTRAGALVTREPLDGISIPQLVHPDPFVALIDLVDLFHPKPFLRTGVDPLASVSPLARLAEDVAILPFATLEEGVTIGARSVVHPGVFLGKNASIGEDCVLWPNVVVREECRIGDRVILHPGAVVGADGFGFARRDGKFLKIRHVGTVVIEDDVEIGANATIDRGTLGCTLIRSGVKIDNLVHIAHNVEIGRNSAMAAQVGISGSTVVGERVLMGGQVGLVDHLTIGDDAILIAQSGVIGNVPERAVVSGYPARPHREVLKTAAELRGLARLRKQIRELERELRSISRGSPGGDEEHDP
jgi:UDP-3-O-[3-hydroxymyristoyl] glucosamine N-acyltransferase